MVHTGLQSPVADVRGALRASICGSRCGACLRLIRRIKGPGIVYCSTVRDVEALHGALPRLGLRVGMYHGKHDARRARGVAAARSCATTRAS